MEFVKKASKWGQPLKSIMLDYVEVSKDAATELKKNPVKSMVWLVFGGIVTACYKKCPNLSCYENDIIEYSNEIGLCAETTRNYQTMVYIDRISTLLNDGSIQFVNLGIFSLIIKRPQSAKCCNYHETCTHLQPRVWTFHHRLIDIGMWNQWLILKKTMVDFDVNENEFTIHSNLDR